MYKYLIHILLLPAFFGCIIPAETARVPVFIDQLSLEAQVNALALSEKLEVRGKDIANGDDSYSMLEVVVVNGPELTRDVDLHRHLACRLARVVRRGLLDPDQFEKIMITLVDRGPRGLDQTIRYMYEHHAADLDLDDMDDGSVDLPPHSD